MRYVGESLPATVTTPEWSLVYSTPTEPVELFHRVTDPAEERNVAGERPDVVDELRDRYLGLLEAVGTSETYLAPRRRR